MIIIVTVIITIVPVLKSETRQSSLKNSVIIILVCNISFLGKYDIVCTEDLVHEIFTTESSNFKVVNDFLHNFKLNAPATGYKNRNKYFKDGGDFGCRFDEINSLVKTLI